ncbi:hypothetical protein [Bacillus horti]|uniref:Pheromone shutdown protein TraB n=1 Tax=Caldalkalibacillus horti TaxID=77523 RepID=A0ABT9W521_9BACI|nr:hypothetical protein [Bacillus horti]MDQ0168354.1 pheromone shutdown protein TraB [Bacillus horti]
MSNRDQKKSYIKFCITGVICILLASFLFFMVRGWYLTTNYVPDILSAYENSRMLQSEVTFGASSILTYLYPLVGVGIFSLFVLWKYRTSAANNH